MMHTQNTEVRLSRLSLKRFFWLGLFVFQLNSTGVVQMTNVKAKVGEVATLPCGNNIRLDKPPSVYWQKVTGPGQPDQVVISYWNGKEDVKDPNYKNRTTMDLQNLTLWISSVKVSDEGKYKCIILYNTTTYDTDLSVVADFGNPIIHVDKHANTCGSTSLTLRCSSHGGYPKPTMSGLLNNNKVEWMPISIPDKQTKLFNITSDLELNVTEDIFFQCTVFYPGFHASASYNYTIPRECPVVKSLSHWIVIAASVSLACFVVVAALACIQGCKRHRFLCCTRSHQPVARSEVNMGAALTPLQFSSGTS